MSVGSKTFSRYRCFTGCRKGSSILLAACIRFRHSLCACTVVRSGGTSPIGPNDPAAHGYFVGEYPPVCCHASPPSGRAAILIGKILTRGSLAPLIEKQSATMRLQHRQYSRHADLCRHWGPLRGLEMDGRREIPRIRPIATGSEVVEQNTSVRRLQDRSLCRTPD